MNNEIIKLKRRVFLNDVVIFIFLGIMLNLLVITFNNGRMPVYDPNNELTIDTSTYVKFAEFNQVKYPYLSDVFKIRFNKYILFFSIGDLIYTLCF